MIVDFFDWSFFKKFFQNITSKFSYRFIIPLFQIFRKKFLSNYDTQFDKIYARIGAINRVGDN
ncbi:hypothetical protein DTL01_03460 [Lactobacillus salivarius]|nr:hypothetical protein [Ligilactobacillus salivarius]OQQ78184.1 hypothetical protein B6U64_00340 [Ligilactobacillus salivarius]